MGGERVVVHGPGTALAESLSDPAECNLDGTGAFLAALQHFLLHNIAHDGDDLGMRVRLARRVLSGLGQPSGHAALPVIRLRIDEAAHRLAAEHEVGAETPLARLDVVVVLAVLDVTEIDDGELLHLLALDAFGQFGDALFRERDPRLMRVEVELVERDFVHAPAALVGSRSAVFLHGVLLADSLLKRYGASLCRGRHKLRLD